MGPLAYPSHVGYDTDMHLMVDLSSPSEELTVRGRAYLTQTQSNTCGLPLEVYKKHIFSTV